MTEISYRFHIRLGNFELDVEGDRTYVEKTVSRYEGRFLPKFQGLLEKGHSIEAGREVSSFPSSVSPASQKKSSVSGSAAAKSSVQAKRGPARPAKPDSSRTARRKPDRRKSRKTANARVMPAPVLPADQELIKQPYIPPDGFDLSGDIPPPTPLVGRSASLSPPTAGARAGAVPDKKDYGKEGGFGDGELKDFFEEFQPRTHHEKIMVFGYFLQERQGKSDFGTGKIRNCYKEAGIDPTGNISQVLNHATRTGFMTKAQRGRSVRYSLTSKGKQFVERGLQKS